MRPATGDAFAPVLPRVSARAMRAFLDRFARRLAADERAAMVLDRAGWHVARALRAPRDVTPVPLPPYAPRLNPVERVRLHLRERHLSHRLLGGCGAVVDALRRARNRLGTGRLRRLTSYPCLEQVNC